MDILRDIVGNLLNRDSKNYFFETTNDTFIYDGNSSVKQAEEFLNSEYRISKNYVQTLGEFKAAELLIKRPNSQYMHEYGAIVFRNDIPIIISYYNGDSRGFKLFNNTFIISGHDGSKLFNLLNPKDYTEF